jgi:regulator of protease activity HflC (stomatin/prohibitin superfamily)
MFLIGLLGFLLILYGIIAFIGGKLNISRAAYNAARTDKYDRAKPLWPVLPFYLPAIVLGIFLFISTLLITKVGPQDVGVVISPSGVRDMELHTGWHIVAPWNSVKFMDKTEWVYTFSSKQTEGNVIGDDAIWVPTSDGIKMGFDISVSWKINPNEASWIYQNISDMDGTEDARYKWIEENIIRTKVKSELALTVSTFTPIECYSNKREEIQNVVFKRLAKELDTKKIQLIQVNIREVSYNPEYEKSINEKKLAEQKALTMKEVTKQKEEQLKQSEIDKNIAIQQAMGESEALKIKGQSITNNPKIIELEWINKWDGQLPTYMMGNGQGIMLNLGK